MPPSVRYYNQTAPFVAGLEDFIASLQEQGSNHPFFAGNTNRDENTDAEAQPSSSNPWVEGWGGFPFGGMPHRGGRHGHHPRGPPPPGPPPPPQHEGSRSPPPPPGYASSTPPPPPESAQDPPEVDPSAQPQGPSHHHHGGPSRHGRCGGRERGEWGGKRRGPPFGGSRGFGGGFGCGIPGGLGALAEMFQSQLFNDENATKKEDKDESFKPDVDIFDTPESFVVHVSLPGAKKNDIGVSWNAETSELSIAGVLCRPGDEELLKTLALDERKVGAFERKVRLGSRANPAQIDADGISAKMEDGVLRVDVPKLDAGYVEIKKVDIE